MSKKNLELAKTTLEKIKKEMKVISSEDIFPRQERKLEKLADHEEKLLSYKKYLDFYSQFGMRRSEGRLDAEAELKQQKASAVITTLYLSSCMMSMGECGHQTNTAAVLLAMNKECLTPIAVIGLATRDKGGEIDDDSSHALLVIGEDCSKLTNLSSFATLSEDSVFLDPLLNTIGKAKDILSFQRISDYYKFINCQEVLNVYSIDPRQKTVRELAEQIYQNACKVSKKWKKTYGEYKAAKSIPVETSAVRLFTPPISNAARIKMELDRITAVIRSEQNWKFSEEKNVAHLQMGKDKLTEIGKYLTGHGVKIIQPTPAKGTSNFYLRVNLDQIEKLKDVLPMPEIRSERQFLA